MARGGHAGEGKMSCGMTSMGTGTPEKEKASDLRGGCPPRKPTMHPGKRKNKKLQWWLAATQAGLAPRKRKKQVISEVVARRASQPGTPEKEKASNFRGGCPPRKSAWHPGKGKSK